MTLTTLTSRRMAEALKEHFGIAEARTWTWGVGVEYENRGWFEAEDGKPETTRLAYFRLYDTTAAALEDALGAENVTVGAHSMSVQAGSWRFWDPRTSSSIAQMARISDGQGTKERTSTTWPFRTTRGHPASIPTGSWLPLRAFERRPCRQD